MFSHVIVLVSTIPDTVNVREIVENYCPGITVYETYGVYTYIIIGDIRLEECILRALSLSFPPPWYIVLPAKKYLRYEWKVGEGAPRTAEATPPTRTAELSRQACWETIVSPTPHIL